MKIILSTYLAVLCTACLYSQEKRYVATAIMKSSIIDYVHAVDSNIVLIDFMKIKKISEMKTFKKFQD